MNSLLIWPIALPLLGSLGALVWSSRAHLIGVGVGTWTLFASSLVALRFAEQGVLEQALGGWEPGLGIALRVDGLAAALLGAESAGLEAFCPGRTQRLSPRPGRAGTHRPGASAGDPECGRAASTSRFKRRLGTAWQHPAVQVPRQSSPDQPRMAGGFHAQPTALTLCKARPGAT